MSRRSAYPTKPTVVLTNIGPAARPRRCETTTGKKPVQCDGVGAYYHHPQSNKGISWPVIVCEACARKLKGELC